MLQIVNLEIRRSGLAEVAEIAAHPDSHRSIGRPYLQIIPGHGNGLPYYRARDTKLNRDVAVKLLSGDLADANARRRFQREAQMASALNHPIF